MSYYAEHLTRPRKTNTIFGITDLDLPIIRFQISCTFLVLTSVTKINKNRAVINLITYNRCEHSLLLKTRHLEVKF